MTANEHISNQNVIKCSHHKLVVSGNLLEYYEYEKPYFFNFSPPLKKGLIERDKNNERRADNLHASRRNIRRIIEANYKAWGQKPIFLTFTFKKNEQNITHAFTIWSQYYKRLNRALSRRGYNSAKYLAVIEFQKRGAIHFHVLYFNCPQVSSSGISYYDLWGQGDVHANNLREIKSVSSYVCKYLQKETADNRLFERKAYFTSKGLIRPREIRHRQDIVKNLNACSIKNSYTESYYTSKYGHITYKQFYKKS